MVEFKLNNIEEERANAFMEKHKACRPKKNNDMFQQFAPYSYIFTPTGISVGVKIVCPYCGKEKDITDYDCW